MTSSNITRGISGTASYSRFHLHTWTYITVEILLQKYYVHKSISTSVIVIMLKYTSILVLPFLLLKKQYQ